MEDVFFIIDMKNVFFENFADENVVVNISIGNYYSMKGSANFIWTLLQQPHNQKQITAALLNEYEVDASLAEDTVSQFLAILQKEQLLLCKDSQEHTPQILNVTSKKEFEPPVLEIYNDLQELLLLDPIHEVDVAQGWPSKNKHI
jgi:hypothetical protein